jgi:hypothetical protein
MRLHSELQHYLAGVQAALESLQAADVELFIEEVLASNRANLRIRVRLAGGLMVAISEAIVVENDKITHLDYRYHCQGPDNALMFRYDSTPHFPGLPGFPEHKHLPGDTVPAARPDIASVLSEANALAGANR